MKNFFLYERLYKILSIGNSGIVSYIRGFMIAFLFLLISVSVSVLVLMEFSNTEISGHSEVNGNAVVSEGAEISGKIIVSEKAVIVGNAEITGNKTLDNGKYNGSWNLFFQAMISVLFFILAIYVFGVLFYIGGTIQKSKSLNQ